MRDASPGFSLGAAMFWFLAQSDPVVDELVSIGEQLSAVLWWAEGCLKIACIGFGVFVIHFLFVHFGGGEFSEFKD